MSVTITDAASARIAAATGPEGLEGIVSVDDHVVEGPNVWQDRLPAKYRDVGPRLVKEKVPSLNHPGTEKWADVWHYEDVADPIARGFAAVGYPPEQMDVEPMLLEEMRPGAYDSQARLSDMDVDGVEVELLFPNSFGRFAGHRFLHGKDRDLALLCVRAYNDWLIEEWCAGSDGRLIPSAIMPLWDVALCADEVRRVAAMGCVALCFSEIPARLELPSMYGGEWEPFLEAVDEARMVINVHIGSSALVHTTSLDAPQGVRISNQFSNSAFSLTDWLASGAFLRHPNLKVAFSEGQAGWAPYLLARMDGMWRGRSVVAGFYDRLPEPPSAYVKNHCYFCVFNDPTVVRFMDVMGDDNLCFETDYPHVDGSWPNSRQVAWNQTMTLNPQQRVKMLRTNAAELYRVERVLRQSR